MAGIMNMAAATLLMAAAIEPGDVVSRRQWELGSRDEGPITVAERNRLINKAAAKKRTISKRKAAKAARKGKR